jgi:deoxycytidylate deaminase
VSTFSFITDYELQYLIRTTKDFAKLSKANRLQVGAVLWDIDRRTIRSMGYNGTPSGESNVCETRVDGSLVTLETVIHAEVNCINKMTWWDRIVGNFLLIVTHAPCLGCAHHIAKVHTIREVLYIDPYRDNTGIKYLTTQKSTHRIYVKY